MGLRDIAKLGQKSPRLEMVGKGKGKGNLAWDDVAGALTGLPRQCTWYAYAMLETRSNDESPAFRNKYTQLLTDHLTSMVWSEMIKREFKPRSMTIGEMSMGIAKSAVYMHFNAKGACKKCRGDGWIITDGEKQNCSRCDGTGVSTHTINERIDYAFGDKKPTKHAFSMSCKAFEGLIIGELLNIRNLIADRIGEAQLIAMEIDNVDKLHC